MAIVNIIAENDADCYQVFQYVVTNPDGTPGAPIDITGTSMEMMLRANAADITALIRFGTDTGELFFITPTQGLFSLNIVQATLVQLALGDYAHSNIMTRGSQKIRIWSGTLTINPGPSR